MFVILALLSIGLGNLVAVLQKSFKRLMGYSTIDRGIFSWGDASINYELAENPVLEGSAILDFCLHVIYLIAFLGLVGGILLLAKEKFLPI